MLALLLTAALATPQAHVWYDRLLLESGYGRFGRERAAFLIEERGGTLTLEPWPHGEVSHATFRGSVPDRTIAIVHTHPPHSPEPSARDRAEAERLGIPVVVITPQSVIVYEPGDRASGARTRVLASGTSRGPSGQRTFLRR